MQVFDKFARGALISLSHAFKAAGQVECFLIHGKLGTTSYTQTKTSRTGAGYSETTRHRAGC